MSQSASQSASHPGPSCTASIIIVNYNAGPRLAKCVQHLRAQNLTDFETIIIDNASTDGSLEGLDQSGLNVSIMREKENHGFAKANNMAAQVARGTWLAFLNPDAYAQPDWLGSLLAAAERYPHIKAFGSTQLSAENPEIIDGLGDVYHAFGVPYRGGFGQPADDLPPDGACFSPCAAAMLIRRDCFDDLGGFDERYFCYGEDVDLGFRLRLAGGHAVQVADAVVHHEGSGVSGRYSDFTVYHGNRNRIWGWFKNMPLALLIPLLPFHLAINSYLLIRAYGVGIGPAYARALRDGFGGLSAIMAARRDMPPRRAPLLSIIRALSWSPLKVSRRAVDLKPLPGTGANRQSADF
ncbi:MAG: glycosyltransferase family 2 protein [Pseudomonadota bacterium]